MKLQRVLVTGGAGFIGGFVCRRLAGEGVSIRVLDDFSSGTRDSCEPGWDVHEGDVADPAAVDGAVTGCDAVVHLAALVSVPESFARREECERINVEGTRIVRDACLRRRIGRLVFASTCAVYGPSDGGLLHEGAVPAAESPYAASKLAGETLVAGTGDLGVALRLFNVYGPRQRADSAYAAAVPSFIRSALRGEALHIFGDGRQTRDFVYVDDVADAVVTAARGTIGGVFNVGGGSAISIATLAETIAQQAGQGASLRYQDSREGDVRSCTADTSQIRTQLGWEARHGLAEGLARTIDWWRDHPGALD